jgi:cytochrome P450
MTPSLPKLDLANPQFSTRSREVRTAREAHWCAQTPYGLAVLRYREVGMLLRDRRLRQGSYAWPDKHGLEGPFAEFWKRSVISHEGTMHRQVRDLCVPVLSEDFVAGLVPAFDQIAAALCAELAERETCEFQEDFAIPFAGQAICALLGLDTTAWRTISHDASDLGLAMGVECKRHEPVFNAACERLTDLARDLVARARRGEDRDSYIAGLVARFEGSGLDEVALLDLIVISIFGGVDTTRSQLGLGLALFMDHPEQWGALRARPDLATNAVEEIIRARPTTTWVTREAVEDFSFGGVEVARGTTLHLLVHASARDPAICDVPGFDITVRRKRHFGFGGGAHHCIGHLVARTDIACALRALASTFRRVEPNGPAQWLPDSGNTSPVTLPTRFTL